jgi:hypothetical protein
MTSGSVPDGAISVDDSRSPIALTSRDRSGNVSHLVIGRARSSPDLPGAGEVIVWGDHRVVVMDNEVLSTIEVQQLFTAYLSTGGVAPGFVAIGCLTGTRRRDRDPAPIVAASRFARRS